MSYTDPQRQMLLTIAKDAIGYYLITRKIPQIDLEQVDEALRQIRATFVTIKHHGLLRGCIGTLQPSLPLAQDVAQHACQAAFADPRFERITEAEKPGLSVHISILSLPQAMLFKNEVDVIDHLQPGVDGVILEEPAQLCRGTFLPSVWETLPDPRAFLTQLKQKAGLPADYWSPTLQIWRYTTENVE